MVRGGFPFAAVGSRPHLRLLRCYSPDFGGASSMLHDVDVTTLAPRRFQAVLDPDACRDFLERLGQAAERLEGRRLWHLNSTEEGGGVAEMLHFLLGYLAGAGIE